ncbi:hypothetical protein, partial [Streptomyces sp. NPDC058656]|uniref:hypothetical protein n=1 Tax=Streptomyces sp. NPDC058656 TaxID=3346578 RepID=UPI00365ADABF
DRPDLAARLQTRGKTLMRAVARLSAGLPAAVVLTIGFVSGACAAEPGRTAPAKPLPWEASQFPTGAGEFTTLCSGGCPQ